MYNQLRKTYATLSIKEVYTYIIQTVNFSVSVFKAGNNMVSVNDLLTFDVHVGGKKYGFDLYNSNLFRI